MMLGCTPVNMEKKGLPAWNFLQCDGNLLTQRRAFHSAVVWGPSMIVWGGTGPQTAGADVSVYHFGSKTWTPMRCSGDPPPHLAAHTAVVWGQHMYVYGGFDGETNEPTSGMWALDLPSGVWGRVQPSTPEPPARGGHAATVAECIGGMLVFGGGGPGGGVTSDLWLFSFDSRAWVSIAQDLNSDGTWVQFPRARKHHTLVHNDGLVYLFGGCDNRSTMTDFHILDVRGAERGPSGPVMRWTAQNGTGFPPTERWGHAAAAFGGRMHLFGGRETPGDFTRNPITGATHSQTGFVLNDWHKFSFRNQIWIRLQPNGHTPLPRWGHTACQYDGQLYVFGGVNQRGVLNDMHSIMLRSLSTVMEDMSTSHLISVGPPLTTEQLLQHLEGVSARPEVDILSKRQGPLRGGVEQSAPAACSALSDDDGDGEMPDVQDTLGARRYVRVPR